MKQIIKQPKVLVDAKNVTLLCNVSDEVYQELKSKVFNNSEYRYWANDGAEDYPELEEQGVDLGWQVIIRYKYSIGLTRKILEVIKPYCAVKGIDYWMEID